jgi:hypothetical protein
MKKNAAKKSKPKHKSKKLALSIQQPFVEQIFRKEKKVEYRKSPTKKINETFYVYASQKHAQGKESDYKKLGVTPESLPTEKIVGTAEISCCRKRRGSYSGDYKWEWVLVKTKRLKKPFEPTRHPQPAWFYPY